MVMELSEKSKRYEKLSRVMSLILVFSIFLGSLVIVLYSNLVEGKQDLEIIAHLKTVDGDQSSLEGRVLLDGEPVNNARVWAIITANKGNRGSPPADSTDLQGEFEIASIPKTIGEKKVTEVTIYARSEVLELDEILIVRGKEILTLNGEDTVRIVRLSIWAVIILPAISIISFMVPFLVLSPWWKYLISITSAILFTFAMIVAISGGLSHVNTNFASDSEKVLSLGFATLFHGSYVEGVTDEWIFSFTSPPASVESTSEDEAGKVPGSGKVSGFGVPLWVLLIAVVGAGLITVSIIVSEIKDRPNFTLLDRDDPEDKELKKFRGRIERIIRHQFYILFSPIGAIFIYQLLVVAEAANNPVTVALSAFGAGASLNLILDKAISYAEKTIKTGKIK